MRPTHLLPLIHEIERAEHESVRALVSVPPRHSKTETLLHAVAWWVARHPEKTVAYATYGDRLTKSKSRLARDYARAAGVELRDDGSALNEWRTPQGGGALFTSIGGPFTGQGCDLLIIDDPHKDRAEAESQIIRDTVYDWYRGTSYSRVEPGGGIIVCHTRWHPDDLIGRLLRDADESWRRVFLPALSDAGEPLWAERWPAAELERKRVGVGPYEWASTYMGEPRPRGGAVFDDVRFYDKLPEGKSFRVTVGLDLAYSAKTHADWSVAVVLAEYDGTYYLLDVVREQTTPSEFAKRLRQIHASHPGARWLWYTSTTEAGLADLLRKECGFPLLGEVAKADKFVRAQPVAAAWRDGKVLVPSGAAWASAFVSELASFTGVNDKHDDQVDSLAAAFDMAVRGAALAKPRATTTQFAGFGGNPFKPSGELQVKW